MSPETASALGMIDYLTVCSGSLSVSVGVVSANSADALPSRAFRRRRGGYKDLIGCEERIHRAGAEALKIEGDKLEAHRLENARELCRHLQGESAWHFVAGDLDANDLPVMAHTELTKAKPAKAIFAVLDGT